MPLDPPDNSRDAAPNTDAGGQVATLFRSKATCPLAPCGIMRFEIRTEWTMDSRAAAGVVMFHIKRAEYPLFLAYLQPDSRLLTGYEAWYKDSARTEQVHRGAGTDVTRVTVRYY